MPTTADLMGLGMPAALAFLEGTTPVTIAPTGATQGAAASIAPGVGVVLFSASTTTANALVFSTAWPIGDYCIVVNVSAANPVSGAVFAPSGGSMNGTANGSVTFSTGNSALFVQTTAGVWISVPKAPG